MKIRYDLLFVILLNVLINIIIIVFFFNKPKRIAVVDFQTIKYEYAQRLINENNKEERIKEFSSKINKLIVEVSQNNNLVILPKQAVFGGEDIDLTTQFRSFLLNE